MATVVFHPLDYWAGAMIKKRIYWIWQDLYQKAKFSSTFGTVGSFVVKVQKVGSSPNS